MRGDARRRSYDAAAEAAAIIAVGKPAAFVSVQFWGRGAARAAGRVCTFTTSTAEGTSNDTGMSLDVPLAVPVPERQHLSQSHQAPRHAVSIGRGRRRPQPLERLLVQLDRGAFQ